VRTRPCGERAFPRSAFSRRRTRRSLLRMAPLADQLPGHGIIQFTSCRLLAALARARTSSWVLGAGCRPGTRTSSSILLPG
jgi:hypothetical protein